jgi:uncharacterized membrane protein YqjE
VLASAPFYLAFAVVFLVKGMHRRPSRYIGIGVAQVYGAFLFLALFLCLEWVFDPAYFVVPLFVAMVAVVVVVKLSAVRQAIRKDAYWSKKGPSRQRSPMS